MDKLLIFSAPSGSGKTTIVGCLMERFPQLEFSVSVTSRKPRGKEKDGREYHFVTPAKFQEFIDNDEFAEWEEVYDGNRYGTLRSEILRIWENGKICIFDIDVQGGLRLKKEFGKNALSFFIKTPSFEELRRRLEGRGTDSPESVERRLSKAESETRRAGEFDHIIVNDTVERAVDEIAAIVEPFISGEDA